MAFVDSVYILQYHFDEILDILHSIKIFSLYILARKLYSSASLRSVYVIYGVSDIDLFFPIRDYNSSKFG